MIKKIKSYMLMISTLLTIAVPVLAPTLAASADCSHIGAQTAIGAGEAANGGNGPGAGLCTSTTGVDQNSIGALASKVVDLFSIVVGAVAIIMIIYGGFRYITSGGDSNRVGSAKNTLIYAIVGLIIVALAQVIVHFVLNTSSSAVQQ
jgi:hypothetical protein